MLEIIKVPQSEKSIYGSIHFIKKVETEHLPRVGELITYCDDQGEPLFTKQPVKHVIHTTNDPKSELSHPPTVVVKLVDYAPTDKLKACLIEDGWTESKKDFRADGWG